ncbi:DUF4304 domain-containing protein [Bacillus mycoides]|nr:DUF4304 domain-containing protein [Bacillus mycoides]
MQLISHLTSLLQLNFEVGVLLPANSGINIGVHPIGLPQLITNHLKIKENISIFDCILQTRIEPINIKKNSLLHNVSHETIHIPDYLSTSHSM